MAGERLRPLELPAHASFSDSGRNPDGALGSNDFRQLHGEHVGTGSEMKWLERWHGARVHTRRVQVLASTAANLLPQRATVLDIGCGDGRLSAHLGKLRPDLSVSGAEFAPRSDCAIPVTGFDGRKLPFADGS